MLGIYDHKVVYYELEFKIKIPQHNSIILTLFPEKPLISMGESHFVNYHTFNCENKEFRNSMNKFLKATDCFITLNKEVFRTLKMDYFLPKYSTAGKYC